MAAVRTPRLLLTLVLIVTLSACAPGTAPPQPADQPPQLAAAVPLPDNAVAKAVDRLDGIADRLMTQSGIPGMAVAVVHGGKTVYAKGFGVRDTTTGEKVDPDTVFQLASLSKSLAATVVAHQVSSGWIDWDTPVVDELPWFALSDPAITRMVTIADFFAHRSGLPDHAGDVLEDLGYDRRTVLERMRLLPLGPFRTTFAYTNFGVTAAAEAVAAAAGRSWEDLSRDVLYRPLGMDSTSSRFADFAARTNRAVGHVKVGDSYQPRYTRNPDAQAPAGGVSSSVNDFAHWLMMMLADGRYNDTRLIGPAALLPALTPQTVSSAPEQPAERAGFYGYGFNISTSAAGRVHLSHSGAFLVGAATTFVIIPDADVAIVALTNAAPTGVPETLTAQFTDLVEFGEIRQDWAGLYREAFAEIDAPLGELAGRQPPADPAPARPLQAYAGRYANDYFGPAVVTDDGGTLTVALGARPHTFGLTHWDGDVFTFAPGSENAPPGSVSAATFGAGTLRLELFDAGSLGTFTR